MYLVVEVLVTVFVLGTFAFLFFKFYTDPPWFMRLSARLCMVPFSSSEREWIAKRIPSLAYFYYGTTGDKEKDASIQRFNRIWSRGFVIVTLSAFALMLVIGVVVGLLSGSSSR